MKKYLFVLILILISFQTAYPGEKSEENKNYGITIYPFSFVVPRLSIDFQVGLGNGTLVPYLGAFMGTKHSDLEKSNFDIEVSYRYILAGPEKKYPRFEGFYAAPLIGFSTYTFKKESPYTSEDVSFSASGFYAGFDLGYQLVWGNFIMNINTGNAFNFLSSESMKKDSEGHDIKFDVSEYSGFRWRGIGFGIGFLF